MEGMMKEEREIYLEQYEEDKGNGFYTRNLGTKFGTIEEIKVPRVRNGNFRPLLLPYYRRTSWEMEDVVVSMYVGGLSTRDISRFLEAYYGIKYSSTSISRLTNVVIEEVERWRKRELNKYYPILYIDATFISLRRRNVAKEPTYVVLGVTEEGYKEVLGFWITGGGESSNVWEEILKELWERGLKEVLIVAADGLTGLEEAVSRVYPKADFQRCVLHQVRNTLNKVRRGEREEIAKDLRKIYQVKDKEEALIGLKYVKERWGDRYKRLLEKWEENIDTLLTFLEYPESIRKAIYTINSLERLMKEVKRRTKVIEVFPGENALEKALYLVFTVENEKMERRLLTGFSEARHFLELSRRKRYGETQDT